MKANPAPKPGLFTFACVVGMFAVFAVPWLATWAACELHTFFHP